MKNCMVSYSRKQQFDHCEKGLTPMEDQRVEELFKANLMQSFYVSTDYSMAWFILRASSKFDVLEFVASLQLSYPNDVEMHEVFA